MGTDKVGGVNVGVPNEEIASPGCVDLIVSEEGEAAEEGDCGGLLTPRQFEDEDLCYFLVSRPEDEDGSVFRTSVAGAGNEDGIAAEDEVGIGDMTGIGMRFADALKRSEEEGSRLVVCFDSLTDLLMHNDEKSSYVFINLMTGRLKSRDAVGHVHLNPGVVGEDAVKRFEPLFDSTVRME